MALEIRPRRNIPSSTRRKQPRNSNHRRRISLSQIPSLILVVATLALNSTATAPIHSQETTTEKMSAAAKAMAKQSYKLLTKKQLSHDSFLLRYALPEGRTILGTDPLLPTCIKVDYQPNNSDKALSKSYSPVSHPNQTGHFDLVVKAYPYREGGGVGKYLCDMQVGSSIVAKLKGERIMHGSPAVVGRGWKHIGLVAGGTGIAPLLQIARIVLESETIKPRVHLLFVNHTSKDILGKDEIDELVKKYPEHFFVTHSFTRQQQQQQQDDDECTANIRFGRGDAALATAALPKPNEDTIVFVCGRDGFVAHWAGPVARAPTKDGSKGPKIQGPLLGVLAEAGFTAEQVFKY
mmetsp:Transcript_14715/g.37020  ORF Transcript_14715/g.37020 Transcript_14715/m.37020 type:complete len:350 (-) Transcript_14715:44-1093(-)